MIACAKMAGIHDEITSMPMSYNSLIGDMGSSLSGGQKQRVLLARALYRTPRFFMDEGTAHLDLDKEKQINLALRDLEITRISVAHRPEMTTGADRVFCAAKHLVERAPQEALLGRTGRSDGAQQSIRKDLSVSAGDAAPAAGRHVPTDHL